MMDIVVDQKQISSDEKDLIAKQVKEDLVDHLYAGCLQGTTTGLVISVVLFFIYQHYTPTYLLVSWLLFFDFMMLALSSNYFAYIKWKPRLSSDRWESIYSVLMTGCAIAWTPAVYFIPNQSIRQYLVLMSMFMASTGYATGTIGQFKLACVTLNIMLIPVIVWCFYTGGIVFNVIGIWTVLYISFLISINYRSTAWFKESLKLKLENTLVSYQANHDLLTDLPNQRLLPQFIETAIQYIDEHKDKVFAIVSFSLNRIERIYDSLGRHAGDTIVQAVANNLKTLIMKLNSRGEARYILTVTRKDTFNIIIVPLSLGDLEEKVKILLTAVDDTFYLKNKIIKMTASIGVSVFPKDGQDAQALLTSADAAMIQAKLVGGSRVEFYRAEINAHTPQQVEMETDLHNAIKNNQFELYYQPLIDLRSGDICGMEALIRWQHPIHGFISPANFIPLAEETGLIIPIGEWVIAEACAQIRKWHKMGFVSLKVAVNLSQKQLRYVNIIESIKQILKKNDLSPNFLEIELTETAILEESVIPVIKEFKDMGLSLAVDDFGTGYSGLSYLKRFSIDKIKIDQSFIRDIPTNNDSMTIVSAILAMARELHVKTLAEGVETVEQLQFLRSKGCDFIQGYYYSKPLEAKFFTQLLLTHREILEYEKT